MNRMGLPFWFTPFKAISRTASVPVGLQDSQRRWMGAHLSKRSTSEQRWAVSRDRAVVARLAHNQEAVGSSPTPATTRTNPLMCAVNRMWGGLRTLCRKQRPPEVQFDSARWPRIGMKWRVRFLRLRKRFLWCGTNGHWFPGFFRMKSRDEVYRSPVGIFNLHREGRPTGYTAYLRSLRVGAS